VAIREISVDQLRPGMFVHDLTVGWMDHPFLKNRFLVEDPAIVQSIIATGIKAVQIDTERGDDVPADETQPRPTPTVRRIARSAHTAGKSSRQEEMQRATAVQQEARKIAVSLMEDVKLGRQVHLEKVTPVVSQMVGSVFRNKEALLSLGRIRRMDQYTFEHSVNVSVLLIAFAKELGLDREEIQEIGTGALLHDVGKIKIPDAILNKPGRLTEDEFRIMRKHVEYSLDVLSATPGISDTALKVAAEHHERYDGRGYPAGLKGETISRCGQMAAIVDVYDALCADRVYHEGQRPTVVLKRLLEWSVTDYNPGLTQRFIQTVGIYPPGSLVRLQSGRLAVVLETGERDLLHPLVRVIYDADKRRFLTPRLLDLSEFSTDGGDAIVGTEDPERWKIKLEVFL